MGRAAVPALQQHLAQLPDRQLARIVDSGSQGKNCEGAAYASDINGSD